MTLIFSAGALDAAANSLIADTTFARRRLAGALAVLLALPVAPGQVGAQPVGATVRLQAGGLFLEMPQGWTVSKGHSAFYLTGPRNESVTVLGQLRPFAGVPVDPPADNFAMARLRVKGLVAIETEDGSWRLARPPKETRLSGDRVMHSIQLMSTLTASEYSLIYVLASPRFMGYITLTDHGSINEAVKWWDAIIARQRLCTAV